MECGAMVSLCAGLATPHSAVRKVSGSLGFGLYLRPERVQSRTAPVRTSSSSTRKSG